MKKFNKANTNCLTDLQSLYQKFDPITSINSGQTFLWEKHGDSWYGIHGEQVVKFTLKKDHPEIISLPENSSCDRELFRLDDDTGRILGEISRDPFLHRLIKKYPGLRLMRQAPVQCIFSFVCASNTNIPMIRRMLLNMTKKFGKPVRIDGIDFFTFPSAAAISKANTNELHECGLGYRAKAIKAAANAIVGGQIDFISLTRASYEEAKKELLQIYGIGNKIADCVLLFSLEKLDAFPIDVWIARALADHYSWLHDNKFRDKITPHQYEQLSNAARKYFGTYAGYAQQYLYYHMRQVAGKKW